MEYNEVYKNKRQHISLDATLNYRKTTCGQKYIYYLRSTIFNSLNLKVIQKLFNYENKNQKRKEK